MLQFFQIEQKHSIFIQVCFREIFFSLFTAKQKCRTIFNPVLFHKRIFYKCGLSTVKKPGTNVYWCYHFFFLLDMEHLFEFLFVQVCSDYTDTSCIIRLSLTSLIFSRDHIKLFPASILHLNNSFCTQNNSITFCL